MQFSRRTLMTAASALTMGAAIPAPAFAAGAATGKQPTALYRYKVGDFEVTAINDGMWLRPIEGLVKNADLADVKKALDAAFLPNDKATIPFTTLVINTGSKLVLIDTGNGDLGAPTSGSWMSNFRAAGFQPENVDSILISHFHPDHINGLRLKDGTAVFPKAEIMVPAVEWAYWMDDAKMNQAPDGLKPNFANVRRVFGPIAKDVKQFEAGKEVAPGITAIATPGHTPGHTSFSVNSGSGKLLVMSDVTNHPALFVRNPDWMAVFDMDGDQARATRRKMLDLATVEKTQVSFYHAPFPATGYIAKDDQGYALVPVAWNPVL